MPSAEWTEFSSLIGRAPRTEPLLDEEGKKNALKAEDEILKLQE